MDFFKLYKKLFILFFISGFATNAFGQYDTMAINKAAAIIDSATHIMAFDSVKIVKRRQRIIGYGSIAAYGSLLYALNKAWYANYPRSSFHLYNDDGEWNQMDKAGHGWTAYQLTRGTFGAWKWAGVSDKKALLYSGISGPGFMTVIEILDGFSSEWGFSIGDMAANIGGSGIFLGQQALWKEQRITYKFSFHRNNYNEAVLETRANELFGNSWYERMLKDYNAQSYWLSANLKSFFPSSHLPAWLNIAVGYGADGMFGGYENTWTDKNNVAYNRTDIKRTRQFFIAPDVDLTKIKTKSKFLRTSFFLLNCIKFPAPAFMIDSKGKAKAYWLYF
jgi:hypothetical protein